MSMFLKTGLICDLCSSDGKLRFCTVQIAEILNRNVNVILRSVENPLPVGK